MHLGIGLDQVKHLHLPGWLRVSEHNESKDISSQGDQTDEPEADDPPLKATSAVIQSWPIIASPVASHGRANQMVVHSGGRTRTAHRHIREREPIVPVDLCKLARPSFALC